MPRVWLFMSGKDSASSGRASWSVSAKSLACFVFCSRINYFYVHAFYRTQGTIVGSLALPTIVGDEDSLIESTARLQSVDDKAVFVFVGDANAHHSEWLESVSHTYRHGRDALDFCNLSGSSCE